MSSVSPSDSALPSKLFFRIGEVAGLVGVEPHVLRYWEREFRSIRPTKSATGQRVYSRKDVENLLRVRYLLYRDGFTIAGAKKRLQRGATSTTQTAAAEDTETEREVGREDEPRDEAHRIEPLGTAPDEAEPEPASQPPGLAAALPCRVDAVVQGKLTALREEVEAFLDELETSA
jgi:DNA-binding transcriptional MerR regulator